MEFWSFALNYIDFSPNCIFIHLSKFKVDRRIEKKKKKMGGERCGKREKMVFFYQSPSIFNPHYVRYSSTWLTHVASCTCGDLRLSEIKAKHLKQQ